MLLKGQKIRENQMSMVMAVRLRLKSNRTRKQAMVWIPLLQMKNLRKLFRAMIWHQEPKEKLSQQLRKHRLDLRQTNKNSHRHPTAWLSTKHRNA